MSFQSRKVLQALAKRGYYVLRQGSNHTIVRRDSDGVQIVVPRHRKLKRGTVRGMASDAGADWESSARRLMKIYHVSVEQEDDRRS